ncbi:MAG: GNAT family N-acetyltransferase [Candidatus Nomurabacteria bacterium]
MEIKNLEKENLNDVLKILQQDILRNAYGEYPGPGWVGDVLESKEKCIALGLFEDDILISVLLSEKLIHKGCIIWHIATDPEKRSLGYGRKLLNHFEDLVKRLGMKWIFLNATEESLNFYKKHGFVTSKYSKVYEHQKDL